MKLTTLKIDKTKAPTDKEIKLPDGDGLYLAITTTNKRVFRYQYRSKIDNKIKTYINIVTGKQIGRAHV